jgi:hypothetical protein
MNNHNGPIDFSHNRVSDCGRPGMRSHNVWNGNMFKNLFVDNNRAGIRFWPDQSGDLQIYNNTIADNTWAGLEFAGGLTTSTYSMFHNIFAFNGWAGYKYGGTTWPTHDRWDWVDKHDNFFFWNYGSMAGGFFNHQRIKFINAQWGGEGGTGTDDITMADAHWNNDQTAWDFSNDADDPYSLADYGTGLLTLAGGEPGGAHSAYVGRSASYTTVPDEPVASPGDPYVEPPATEPPAVSIIVDTSEADIQGAWTCPTGVSGAYNSDHCWYLTGDVTDTVTWPLDIPDPGIYNVYAWWASHSNRATDAPFTIKYGDGTDEDTVDMNQEINGSQWVLLGTYYFEAGTACSVVLSADGNEYVIADAIKVEPGLSW